MVEAQMSDSFRTAAMLAFVGGFLETYTFVLHGHVFANAQTGNIALLGMSLASGRWLAALKYLVPILSFAGGVALVEWVRGHWPTASRIHWRQFVVIVEALLLCPCAFLVGTAQDMLANLIVSVVCAFQVQAFRKVRGSSYASTMCTGNLRSATIAWLTWREKRLPEARRQAVRYVGVISVFVVGAAVAIPFVTAWRERAVLLVVGLLVVVAAMMHSFPENE